MSRGAERLLGYPAERWLAEPDFWVEHMHPEDRSWVPGLCREQARRGETYVFEYRMRAADGRTVWLRDACRSTLAGERVTSLQGVMLDVSERKQAEAELRRTGEGMRALITHAPVLLFAIDRSGVVTLCEGRAMASAGIDAAEVVGRPVWQWPRLTPRVERNLRRALAGDAFTDTLQFEERFFEVRYTPVRDESGQPDGMTGVGMDITDRIHADAERQELEAQVRHSQKLESLGVLAGGVAHDFNNLLTTILGNAELARAELSTDTTAGIHVERIQRAAKSAANLTQQLLSYAGQSALDVRPVELSSLVAGMVDLLRVSVSKKATLECDLARELPTVDGDAAQLQQVVLNLITNASEALEQGSGVISVQTGRVDLTPADLAHGYLHDELEEGPYVYLEVRDTGVGMDEETLSRIFDPFFTTKFVGRGLGLATVIGIVRAHSGAVSVRSRRGQGSRFRVFFPLGATTVSEEERPPALPAGGGTVLVVDDEPDVRELTHEFLKRLGYGVVEAVNGTDALARVQDPSLSIDAVLLDATMPEMSGEEVALELVRLRPNLPMVLMSGYRQEVALSQLPERLVAGFLQKPFEREELARVLAAALAGDDPNAA